MLQTKPSHWSRRILKLVVPYWTSSVKFRAWKMVAFLVAMWAGESYAIYLSSNASNHMMTALSEKHIKEFWHEMLILAGTYLLMTVLGVSCYYLKKILELDWREWLTKHMLDKYLSKGRAYYRLSSGSAIDNPDERLATDVSCFVGSTLSFFDIIVSNTMSLATYCVILWKIWPPLIAMAIIFSALASLGSLKFGSRLGLKQINFNLIKNEADFRYELMHLRTNAESIAFYSGESEKRRSIVDKFSDVIKNCKRLFKAETLYDCYTSIYRHLTTWLPLLILAPRFFAGDLKLGDLTQAQGAFSSLLSRCSIIVNFYDWFANYAAITDRLASFSENTELPQGSHNETAQIITIEKGELALSNLYLYSPDGKQLLIDNLSANLLPGKGLAISGPPGSGKTSLLRAISGLWCEGTGLIIRPALSNIIFLPQKPYMPIGSLREQLCFPRAQDSYSDDELLDALDKVNLAHLPGQYGGLDSIARWQDELSPGQQQLISFARILLAKPEIVVLDEATGALDNRHESIVYELLLAMNVSFVSIVHKPSALKYHHEVLVLNGDSSWTLQELEACSEGHHKEHAERFMPDKTPAQISRNLAQSAISPAELDDTVAALRKLLKERNASLTAIASKEGRAAESSKTQ